MKKILILLLLFTITLFYSIPTQAYTLDGNDIPLVQTKNLFDKDTAIIGQGIASDGSIFNEPAAPLNFYHPDYIPIEAGQQITFSNDVSVFLRVAFYNLSQTFIIRQTSISASATFTAPTNSKFFRVSAGTNDLDFIQVERGSTATSYAPYGFLTLNDIFEQGNLIVNGTFDNNINNWFTLSGRTLSYQDNFLRATRVSDTPYIAQFRSTNFGNNNNNFYIRFNSKSNISGTLAVGLGNGTIDDVNAVYNNQNVNIDNLFKNYSLLSNITTATLAINVIRFNFTSGTSTNDFLDLDNIYVINLNSLGLSLTKESLDYYYNLWEKNNAYIEGYDDGFDDGFNDGFTDGFNDGFDDGFDDGVASDTSFAVGYALGLSQGADMETGLSLLILIVALIGFILMIIGFITKRGIFNLLSTGAFIVLGGLLVEFVGFIIIAIGLVLINIYYAFFGNI